MKQLPQWLIVGSFALLTASCQPQTSDSKKQDTNTPACTESSGYTKDTSGQESFSDEQTKAAAVPVEAPQAAAPAEKVEAPAQKAAEPMVEQKAPAPAAAEPVVVAPIVETPVEQAPVVSAPAVEVVITN